MKRQMLSNSIGRITFPKEGVYDPSPLNGCGVLRASLAGDEEESEKAYDLLESMWNEPNRYYHDMTHLNKLCRLILADLYDKKISEDECKKLILVAVFHDAVLNDEVGSAELYRKMSRESFDKDVYEAILDTKDHTKKTSNRLSEIFNVYDLHNLLYGSVEDLISDSHLLMREYGHVDWSVMSKNRIGFIENIEPYIRSKNDKTHISEYLVWLKSYRPRIAAFAGTFFPMHKGHINILEKAEKIFDKVIVACGINPAKVPAAQRDAYMKEQAAYMEKIKQMLPNNQVEMFDGFVTDYIKTKPYHLTIVKGLRNPSDFDSEKITLRYMEDIDPNIDVIYIISDRQFEHVSSSGIKQVKLLEEYSGREGNLTEKYLKQ